MDSSHCGITISPKYSNANEVGKKITLMVHIDCFRWINDSIVFNVQWLHPFGTGSLLLKSRWDKHLSLFHLK